MTQPNIIKTTNYNNDDIINDIIKLYLPDGIELDPTYSKGVFYKNLNRPNIMFDLYPQYDYVNKADCRELPIKDNIISSIMFDPPFTAGIGKNLESGIIRKRFTMFKNMKEAYKFFEDSLDELYRILKKDGVLVFKIQDTVSQGKQWITHNHVINHAEKLGFKTEDIFILLAKNRIIGKTHHNQKHARKYHSYFLVFIKQ